MSPRNASIVSGSVERAEEAGPIPPAGASLGAMLTDGSPLRFELLFDERDRTQSGADAEDLETPPLLVLSDYGGNSRVHLGRIVMGNLRTARYVAIKLAASDTDGDAEDAGDSGESGAAGTQQARQRRLEAECGHYAALCEKSNGFSPLFSLPGAGASGGAGDGAAPGSWPPLLYSKKRRLFFRPLSSCGTPLATCRDSKLLAKHGLPACGAAAESYLYNEEDVRAGEAPVFYQFRKPGPAAGKAAKAKGAKGKKGGAAEVKSLADCLQELARIPGMPGAEPPDLSGAAQVRAFARLCAAFPPIALDEREAYFADDSFLDDIVVFSGGSFTAVVLELNRFHYDEFCDLLGGVTARDFRKKYLGEGVSPGHALRLGEGRFAQGADDVISEKRRFLFGADDAGLDALESFKLKWTLFTQVCRSLRAYHQYCGSPHLTLEPAHVMVQLNEPAETLPAMWQAQARLISLGGETLEIRSSGAADAAVETIPLPPANANPLYQAEAVINGAFGMVQTGSLTVTALDQDEESKAFRLSAELEHEGLGPRELSLHDYVKLNLKPVAGLGDFSFFARRDPAREYASGKLFLIGGPLKLNRKQQTALKQIRQKPLRNIGFALYPRFDIPCDIYSLGMLLFRTLIVNDDQPMDDVARTLAAACETLARNPAAGRSAQSGAELLQALTQAAGDLPLERMFAPSQVFYYADDRAPGRPNAIPPPIWREALALGLRMIAQVDGFSICAHHGDFDPNNPAARMEFVVQCAQRILAGIDTALFSRIERNAEIRAALDLASP